MHARSLVIGNKNYSSWSLRSWLFLSKNEISFSETQLWLDAPGFKPAINQYQSGGKVPVLKDGEIEVWDSLAIIEYVIERYDCVYSWPEAAELRAHARSIVCEMHSSFTALRSECPMDIRGRYQRDLSSDVLQDIERICHILRQALNMSGSQGRWLYGDFSVADAVFAPVVFRFNSFGIHPGGQIDNYMQYLLADETVNQWVEQARLEPHHIEV